jgi:hypothetical protein
LGVQAEALGLGQQLVDDAQGIGNGLSAGIVAGVGQGLVLAEVAAPAAQLLAPGTSWRLALIASSRYCTSSVMACALPFGPLPARSLGRPRPWR